MIQINPRETGREPKTVAEIADRRNELAGNLSLYQELGFIEKIDHRAAPRELSLLQRLVSRKPQRDALEDIPKRAVLG